MSLESLPNSTSLDPSQVLQEMSFIDYFSYFCQVALVFGGIVPYIPQYRQIKRTQNADGFSSYVCLCLLIANILRIIYWFGHPFELPLLFQSIIMNIAMLVMVHLCVRVRVDNRIIPLKPRILAAGDSDNPETKILQSRPTPRSFWDFDSKYFWQWTDFLSYLEFLATFAAVMGILMYFCIDQVFIVETIGCFALMTEAVLGVPQFYRNLQKRSVFGMSKTMVFLWTVGDCFKFCYAYFRKAPIMFFLGALCQIVFDLLIACEVLIFDPAPDIKLIFKQAVHTS